MNNKNKNFGNAPLIIWYLLAVVVIIVLHFYVGPGIQKKPSIEKVDYYTFLKMVDDKKIDNLEDRGTEYYYTLKETGKEKIYQTTAFNDPNLVDRLYSNDVKFEKVVPKELNPILSFIITTSITLVAFIILGQILSRSLFKKMGGGGGIGPMSFGKSNAKIYVKDTEGVNFSNVQGQDEAKDALSEIVSFLHNPAKYTEIGAKLPKGALLVGPPGTGKTMLAQAVANEANVPFFSISGSEFVEMFVGLGAAKVRDLFKQANEKAPCIVFIDEIDTIGKKRDGMGFSGNDEREQTLNQLLSEMDGFDATKGVVILAATNRPESLDPALLRPGRFDRRIPVELPDLKGREAILKVHAKKIKKDDDIDYVQVARATAGASGADLANMVNEAALRAVREGRNKMTQEDLEASVDVILAGYERKNAVISQKEKEIIAYHEVGHAIVAAKQSNSAPVHKITIVPRTSGALGFTMQVDEEEKFLLTKEEALNKITTFAGGRSAEELIFGTKTSGASNDIEQATRIARSMITKFGMSDKFGFVAMETTTNKYLGGDSSLSCSPATEAMIDEEVRNIVERAHEKAINILKENMEALHEISRFLLTKETISGEEFMEILNKYA